MHCPILTSAMQRMCVLSGNPMRRCLCHTKQRAFNAGESGILGNMAELMVREIWGAYEHVHQHRIAQLVRAGKTHLVLRMQHAFSSTALRSRTRKSCTILPSLDLVGEVRPGQSVLFCTLCPGESWQNRCCRSSSNLQTWCMVSS